MQIFRPLRGAWKPFLDIGYVASKPVVEGYVHGDRDWHPFLLSAISAMIRGAQKSLKTCDSFSYPECDLLSQQFSSDAAGEEFTRSLPLTATDAIA
jgi:hypothetical protein